MKKLIAIVVVMGLTSVSFGAPPKQGVAVTAGGRTYDIGVVTGPDYQHEILINGSTQISAIQPGTAGLAAFGGGQTYFNFAAGYNYAVIPMLSMGAQFSIAQAGATGTVFSLLAGPTFNLIYDGSVQNSFFVDGALGITSLAGASAFTFRFDLGKRFYIFDHLTYRPSFGILKIGGGNVIFVFNLLSGSIQF